MDFMACWRGVERMRLPWRRLLTPQTGGLPVPSRITSHGGGGLGCCQVYNTPRIYPQKRTGQEHPLTSPLIHHINTMTK
ncbi:unnamed protein product [Gadus morhua 'NCC']